MPVVSAPVPTSVSSESGVVSDPWPRPVLGWSAAVLLTLAMFVSYVDRTILALLIEPIKASLGFSDVQMGLLHGLTFGLVFTLTMAPCGWLADNVNRTRLLGIAVAFWSVMTATCGLATNFAQMFVARMGVAVGEATLGPSAPSLLADYFPPERRTPPLSLYSMGAGAGVAASLLIGGLVASLVGEGRTVSLPLVGQVESWQIIFFTLALPGLFLSLLFFLQREPRRRNLGETKGTLQELKAVLVSRRGIILPHMAGYCLFNVFSFAVLSWLPAFFMRVHGWSIAEVGIRLGTVQLATGICGAFAGGVIARSFWKRGRLDANLLTGALFLGVMTVPAVGGALSGNPSASLFLVGLMNFCLLAPSGPLLGAVQDIVPSPLRGRVTALYYIVLGLVGMTFGPLVIGFINDHVFVYTRGIGKSIALTAIATLPLAAVCLAFAARQRTRLDWKG